MSAYEIIGVESTKGSGLVTMFPSEPGGPGFRIIHGDHRPMREFLEAWSRADFPLVSVNPDGSLRLECEEVAA